MRKVLLVSCDGLGNGGVQAVIMNIVRNLHHEFQFDILLFTSETRYYDHEFESYGGRIIRIPKYEGKSRIRQKLDYYIRGRNIYKKTKQALSDYGPYDAVHCHDEYESAMIIKAAAETEIPIRITHTHVISGGSNIIAKTIEKHRKKVIEQYSTLMLGCSEEANRSFYLHPDKAIVINNPYDDSKFKPTENKPNAEKVIRFVQIGGFYHIKNQVFSVKVIAKLRKAGYDARLTLIGFQLGGYKELVEKYVEEHGLREFVTFLPGNADSPKLLSEASYLLMPSLHEGFGIVLIEAQAMGVKCFASDHIPRSTNCGGVEYLPLETDSWAESITEDYKKTHGIHHTYNVEPFKMEKVASAYKAIYAGEKIFS